MLSSLFGALVGAIGRAFTNYLAEKRDEARQKLIGKLEEQNNVFRQNAIRDREVRNVVARLGADPDFAKLVRDRFSTSKRGS